MAAADYVSCGLHGTVETAHGGDMDAGVWASWAAVVVAVVVAVRAYVSERRAKKSAEDTEVLKQRTVAASERSARAIEQVAEALVKANATSGSDPLYQGPTWSLDFVRGSKYALVNNTPYLQANVVITGAPIRGDSESPGDVAPFGEHQFLAISAWGLDDKITVAWTDNVGIEQSWSKPLPPKTG